MSNHRHPGPLSLYADLVGWHSCEMHRAMEVVDKWKVSMNENPASGSWNSNFFYWLRYGPFKDDPRWDKIGHVHGGYTQRVVPMRALIKKARTIINKECPVSKFEKKHPDLVIPHASKKEG